MLELYLASLAFSWGSILIWDHSFSRKLKKEGLRQVELSDSFEEKIISQFKDFIRFSIPVFNVIVSFMVIFDYGLHYEEVKNRGIAKGYIEPIDKNTNINDDYYLKTAEKEHKELSNKEKIEYLKHEKEFLNNFYNDNSDKEEYYTKKKNINSD